MTPFLSQFSRENSVFFLKFHVCLAGAAEALKQQEEDELKEGGLSFDDEYSEHHPAFEGETGFESELDPDKTSLAPHSASSTKKHFTNSPQR